MKNYVLPSSAELASVIESLSCLAGIDENRKRLYVNLVGEVVLAAWQPQSEGKFDSDRAKIRGDAGRIDRQLSRLLYTLNNSGIAAQFKHVLEDDFSSCEESLLKLLWAAEYVKNSHKLRRGGQIRRVEGKDADPFDIFVAQLLRTIRIAGGNLTVNKNNIDDGTLRVFLLELKCVLPPGLIPAAISPGRLAGIKSKVTDQPLAMK